MTLGKPSTLQSSIAKDGNNELGCVTFLSLVLVLRDSSAMTLRVRIISFRLEMNQHFETLQLRYRNESVTRSK